MRLAVGLFHFNVQYVAGQTDLYHRYCTEAVAPFLELVERRKDWRMSFEMAGNGLEFLARNYPATLALLRKLTTEGRIELISTTYVPTIWPAFPARDLITSIELNRECLRSLDLPCSRIFFAHEAFFGLGACDLTDYFDVAVCKDDYLRYICPANAIQPAYRTGKTLVLVGANHLVNELYRRRAGTVADRPLFAAHQRRIEEAAHLVAASASPCGSYGDIEWQWYHLGSGHNVATWRRPEDGDEFFFDPDWAQLVEELLDSYPGEGYEFATVGELAQAIDPHVATPLPPIIEGSWDSRASEMVFAWMGRQHHVWEDDCGVLRLAWEARNRLVALERASSPERAHALGGSIKEIWKLQLLAESSDSLGWAPKPREVEFVKEAARKVLDAVAALTQTAPDGPTAGTHGQFRAYCRAGAQQPPFVACDLFGAEGELSFFTVAPTLQVVEAWMRPSGSCFGVRFHAFPPELVYCPSGREEEPARISWHELDPSIVYLPLANGLIGLGDGLYLIRDNASAPIAACADRTARHVSFMVRGPNRVKQYRWRFFLFRGALDEAVQRANRLNYA